MDAGKKIFLRTVLVLFGAAFAWALAYEISKQELFGVLVALAYLAIFTALYVQVGRKRKDGPTKGGKKGKLLPKRNGNP